MLGALRLVRMVLDVETAVLERRMDAAEALLDELELCGRRTAEQLRQDLGD
jgi:hypothetical protein